MQLTDKVLLPATISYTDGGQRATSACSDDATQLRDVRQTQPAAEAVCSGVCEISVPAAADDGDNDGRVDAAEGIDSRLMTLATGDSATHPLTISSRVEADAPSSAANRAGLYSTDSTGNASVMTLSLVNFPSDVGMGSASGCTLSQPLPMAVQIGDTLLHCADTDIGIKDSASASDSHLAASSGASESKDVTSNVVSNHNSLEDQQLTEWTRYVIINALYKSIFNYLFY